MSENEEENQEPTTEDSGERNIPASSQTISDANKAAERMEKATEEAKVENDRKEALAVEGMLGGKTEAGHTPVKQSEDAKWAKEAKDRYDGTGLDPTPDDTPTTYS